MNIWVKLILVAFGLQLLIACATAGGAAIGTGSARWPAIR
jgi:hypothetical protein